MIEFMATLAVRIDPAKIVKSAALIGLKARHISR
jgi:hypothetical protein